MKVSPEHVGDEPPPMVRLLIDVVAAGAILYSVASIVLGQYWIACLGNISSFSLLALALIYLTAESSLTHAGLGRIEAMVLSVLFANGFLQSYEIIYHFSFPVYFNHFNPPFLDGDGIRYLIERFLSILPIALIRRQLSFGRLSLVSLLLFMVLWGIWILCGFPQYFAEDAFYPIIIRASDKYALSLMLNFGSKLVLAVFYISLLRLKSPLKDLSSRLTTL